MSETEFEVTVDKDGTELNRDSSTYTATERSESQVIATEYDFWLFDFDGTIVDVEWEYTRSVFDRVGNQLGMSFSDNEVEQLWHGLGESRNAQVQSLGIDTDTFWSALHEVENPTARAEATYLHDDAAVLLNELHAANIPIGVVTHCQSFLAEPVVDYLDIGDWFDTFVTCTPELGWKPDPDPVYHAIESLGQDPSKPTAGVLAGDAPSDVGAAWNAGLAGLHIERHSPEQRGRCVLGDYRVDSLDLIRHQNSIQ
ncbi:HAD family hydrolase [Haloquadratum walsbyi]|uniref:Putative phosphatase n=1 Tax=Haloquadratum walsbyi J07HQW2 TaxID=1238425 RepID=U1MYI4_9EURY|nr:HAD family hydrolase [Haloquadratum walsbyi]ERG95554.1 MAG: putative phosphatase [Haloquadratum walsbyi J07HQW2]